MKRKIDKDLPDSTDHKGVKLSYTIFPKDWTAEQIYEFLIARAEEDEKGISDVSDKLGAWKRQPA